MQKMEATFDSWEITGVVKYIERNFIYVDHNLSLAYNKKSYLNSFQ